MLGSGSQCVTPFAWIALMIKHTAMLGVSIHVMQSLLCFVLFLLCVVSSVETDLLNVTLFNINIT